MRIITRDGRREGDSTTRFAMNLLGSAFLAIVSGVLRASMGLIVFLFGLSVLTAAQGWSLLPATNRQGNHNVRASKRQRTCNEGATNLQPTAVTDQDNHGPLMTMTAYDDSA